MTADLVARLRDVGSVELALYAPSLGKSAWRWLQTPFWQWVDRKC